MKNDVLLVCSDESIHADSVALHFLEEKNIFGTEGIASEQSAKE